jgi:hypothetical protein
MLSAWTALNLGVRAWRLWKRRRDLE